MPDPYRELAARDDDGPRRLLVPIESAGGTSPRVRAWATLVGGVFVSLGVARFGPAATLAITAVTALASGWLFYRARSPEGLLFEVVDDRLAVTPAGARSPVVVRLADLRDVRLDTRSIRRVTPGGEPTGAQFIESRVGPEVDVSRIVLESSRSVLLFAEHIPHSAAVEMLGRIRSFLRQRGWQPEDERPRVADDDEADDDEDGTDEADDEADDDARA